MRGSRKISDKTRSHKRKPRPAVRLMEALPMLPISPVTDVDLPSQLLHVVEAILFASGEPINIAETAKGLSVSRASVDDALSTLSREYDEVNRGMCVRVFGGSAQMITRQSFAPFIRQTMRPLERQPLSHHILETLAIVAYRQPVTRAEIDQARGVKSESSVTTLIKRGLIKELGHRDTLGHPTELGTTDLFLSHFGLAALEELPNPTPADDDTNTERISI